MGVPSAMPICSHGTERHIDDLAQMHVRHDRAFSVVLGIPRCERRHYLRPQRGPPLFFLSAAVSEHADGKHRGTRCDPEGVRTPPGSVPALGVRRRPAPRGGEERAEAWRARLQREAVGRVALPILARRCRRGVFFFSRAAAF